MAVIVLSYLPRRGDTTDGCGMVGEHFFLGQVLGSPIKPYVEVFWSLQPVIMSPPSPIGRCLRCGLVCADAMSSGRFWVTADRRTLTLRWPFLPESKRSTCLRMYVLRWIDLVMSKSAYCLLLLFCVVIIIIYQITTY